ncbi:EAL domain-containing protein (putative c-di-GMP-specific phosphodiesterase class I) [Halospina denitrificans]|uniref:EAL domain-containing protein (Putative c-di-GMP-specific phosphodiesterase class I) n=1 Tax=Halospina denitrificans TaxID=332522 RepID=A0A4R7JNK8_9GAMM|nr:EAL domain-containing protein [Halospina denitrificans]TDT39435.1 EAL domain-containing protein (putative c-di-GMP-specific phosphodiesterase class I) [Halospina denitrificans]
MDCRVQDNDELFAFSTNRGFDMLYSSMEDIELTRTPMHLQDILDNERFRPVYQPIHRLSDEQLVGFEALTRFTTSAAGKPGYWFNQAALAGLTETLEHAVLERALRDTQKLTGNRYMSLNISPSTILDGTVTEILSNYPLEKLVLEITEHEAIQNYRPLLQILAPLREAGLRIAIDDAGSGYASFRHVLEFQPEIIKLDQSLARDIDANANSQALIRAMTGFAVETGCQLLAEGVETRGEAQMLRHLGIDAVQGYYFGAPEPLGRHAEGWRQEVRVTGDSEG